MSGVRFVTNAVVAVLLAPRCASCESSLEAPLDGAVCDACWRAILPITPPVCDGCGNPLARVGRCQPCREGERAVDRGRSVGEYAGVLREIIHAFKYERRPSLAPRLSAMMRLRGQALIEAADHVVPVPLHPRRLRQRGFNQARELARHLGPPVLDAIERIRHTEPQMELPADKRHTNVRDAFRLKRTTRATGLRGALSGSLIGALIGSTVVLVDDVCTTGATLEACARVLKEGGVRTVCALTAARVVPRQR